MSAPKLLKKAIYKLSPGIGEKCSVAWASVEPIVRGRMSPRGAAKYFIFGVCPGIAGKFRYFGVKVYFPLGSVLFRLTCERGEWEPEVTSLLCRLAKPGQLFIDVGANIGLTSIPVLRTVTGARVLSFEPSPNSVKYIQRTRDNSVFRDVWEIVPKAASDSLGTVQFYVAAARAGAWDGLQDTKQAGDMRQVTVSQTTLDAEWQRLGRPRVSCIKIDVEGSETRVLRGAVELIKQERPHVVLEWSLANLSANGIEPGLLLEYAASQDYDLFSVPQMQLLSDLKALTASMSGSEMFLLAPRARSITARVLEADQGSAQRTAAGQYHA